MRSMLSNVSRALLTLGALAMVFTLPLARPAAAQDPRPEPDLTGAKTLYSGTWTKKTNKIAGSWSIVEKAGKRYVILDKKFKTQKAPDLKIILSPTKVADLENKNAMKSATVVSLLRSHKGAQTFEIPKSVKLEKLATIAIHCEKYTKLWGASALEKDKNDKP